MQFIILLFGFFFLIKGADIFVNGASSIARKFNVPSMIIGLTIVALGTSAPEAAVSITSSLAGQNDMSVANVVGSNLFNILIVLGISSIFRTLPVQSNTINKDTPFLIIVSILLLIFSFNLKINRIEGTTLLIIFIGFIMYTIKSALHSKATSVIDEEVNELSSKEMSLLKTILISIIGIIGIVIGGDMVVNSASSIATSFGMSATLVGLTIVAIGTSLPEFVTSIIAVRKGETEIAIGNVIGSNIFNILLILGLASSISPIKISIFAFIDELFMVLITTLLYLFMRKDSQILKKQGYILVMLYIAYITYSILR